MVLDIDMFFIVCLIVCLVLLCLSVGAICLLKRSIYNEAEKINKIK